MKQGDSVRLRSDPTRVGTVLPKNRQRGNRIMRMIQFPDGNEYVPEDLLEPVSAVPDDPLELLEDGKLSSVGELRRAIVRARLTGRLANLLYSLESTDTDFLPYQFKPVVKLLQSPSTGILIADEVGLGKTIEAGLIWTELRSRVDARRLLVLCPSVLRPKWQRELRQKFGVEAEIVGAQELYDRLLGTDGLGNAEFALIASLQAVRPPKGWEDEDKPASWVGKLARLLSDWAEEDPLFDLLVVDEAHYLRNPATQTSEAGRLFRAAAEHAVFLSATPVHLRNDDLFHLLRLVDEDAFGLPSTFVQQLEANAPLLKARDLLLSGRARSDSFCALIQQSLAHPVLRTNRQLKSIIEKPPSDEDLKDKNLVSRLAQRVDSANLLGFAVTRTRKRDVEEGRITRKPVDQPIALTRPERAFYDGVTKLVRQFCAQHKGPLGFMLVTPQRQMSSSMPAALRSWLERAPADEELVLQDAGADEPDGGSPLLQTLIGRAATLADYRELRSNDSKFNRFKDILRDFLDANPQEKVVVFSYFRETLRYLHERLQELGITSILLRGGDDKEDVLDAFKKPSGPRVLLSSEVGSEGLDLQFCRFLVNYDLPWNPMRLEQRIGRIDRIGQASPFITIWNLFYAETIDARIYTRLYQRLGLAEFSLGALEPILAKEIRELTIELLSQELSPEEELARIEQRGQALANKQLMEEELEKEASHLVRYGDYILQQVQAARELGRRVTEADVRDLVIEHFGAHYPGCEFRQSEKDEWRFEVALSAKAKHDVAEYLRAAKIKDHTLLTRNDPRPVECVFTNKIVTGRSAGHPERIHQVHPLVRFVSATGQASDASQRPAVAFTVERSDIHGRLQPGSYAFAVQFWSVTGIRTIEQLYFCGIDLGSMQLVPPEDVEVAIVLGSARGQPWVGVPGSVLADGADAVQDLRFEHCVAAYDDFVDEIRAANEDRADAQLQALQIHLAGQQAKYTALATKHRVDGREGLARAAEARIRQLVARIERQRLKIAQAREHSHRSVNLCVGVFQVVEHP